MPTIIELTQDQLVAAHQEAERRQSQNEARGLKGRNRAPATGEKALRLHRLGCIGEIAAAAFLGLDGQEFALRDAVRGSTDLPGDIEVKTRPNHGYDLLVQIDDDPNKIFVLVTHDDRSTQVAGWIRGHDAMKKEWIKEYVKGRPCYAVRQSKLNPPETLATNLGKTRSRILGVHEAWLAQTEDEGGDLILNFNFSLMEELGWKTGDTLVWDIDPDNNQCIIRKSVNERPQNKTVGIRVGVEGNGATQASNQRKPDDMYR